MLARRSLPFEKALCTVKINRMTEGAITTRRNQAIETNIIKILDSRVRFKIIVEGNFSIGNQQHKVNTSLENLKKVPFTNNTKRVPPASTDFDTSSSKKIIYRRNTKCITGRRKFCKKLHVTKKFCH